MEKFIFLATLKEKLTELEIPQTVVDKHVKIFEDCFVGKSAAEVDSVIEGAGGLEGIVRSVYNLEKAKEHKSVRSDSKTKENSYETSEDNVTDHDSNEFASKEMTLEINTQTRDDIINEHIREAEEITSELEKTTVNKVISGKNTETEFADDISEYDFEVLFAEKLSKPEKLVKELRENMSEKTYKSTLPLAIIADVLLFLISILLYPILIASAIFVTIVYIGVLIAGICFALVPIAYGIYISFKTVPIALYEMGIGLISLGTTMLMSILLYNYVKRLVPYLFKQLKKLFALCVRLTKRYFNKDIIKEEA